MQLVWPAILLNASLWPAKERSLRRLSVGRAHSAARCPSPIRMVLSGSVIALSSIALLRW